MNSKLLKLKLALGMILICSQSGLCESSTKLGFEPYGFILFEVLGSTRATDSFGNQNLSAPTTVHPDVIPTDASYRSSLQVQQSRAGFWFHTSPKVKAQVEIDFINFASSSPTTGSRPRLRIAKIVYSPNKMHEFTVGQDWDVFSPLNPFTYSFVGLYFEAGNAGFMRQQAKWKLNFGSISLTLAAGLPGRNENSTDSNLELNNVPSGSAAVSKKLGNSEIGLSVIGSRLKFVNNTQPLYGINPFFSLNTKGFPDIRAEAYYGQGLSSSGALTLASSTDSQAYHEAGGYLSFSGQIIDGLTLFGGGGHASVIEASGSTAPGISGARVNSNSKAALGLSYKLTSGLSIYGENGVYFTNFTNTVSQVQTTYVASVSQAGLYYEF